MILQNIISQRFTTDKSFWQTVYEWEDIFAHNLDVELQRDCTLRYNKLISHIPGLTNLFTTKQNSLIYEMAPRCSGMVGTNKTNIVPYIIDFYLKENQLEGFTNSYSNNRCIFISSLEVYEYLKQKGCTLPIKHLALSISDKYKISPNSIFCKNYDLVLMGRPNPVLLKFLTKYKSCHTDFVYIYNKLVDHKYQYFTSEDQPIGTLETREEYLEIMRKAKITFYSTPGIDGGETRTNGFNQVTPRFLEQVACGCHIIARYQKNPDTDYYELNRICSSINNYEEFECALNRARHEPVNMKLYSEYLANHYTSVRAKQLTHILKKI